jgi:hypothetical protein
MPRGDEFGILMAGCPLDQAIVAPDNSRSEYYRLLIRVVDEEGKHICPFAFTLDQFDSPFNSY